MDVTPACEPVVHDHDCHYRRDKAEVRTEECKEVLSAVHQEPRNDGPDEDVTEDHATDNGEVFREETI